VADGYAKSSFACEVSCTVVAIQNDARLNPGSLRNVTLVVKARIIESVRNRR